MGQTLLPALREILTAEVKFSPLPSRYSVNRPSAMAKKVVGSSWSCAPPPQFDESGPFGPAVQGSAKLIRCGRRSYLTIFWFSVTPPRDKSHRNVPGSN